MFLLGPSWGIVANAAIYLPSLVWLWKAPYGPRFRTHDAAPRLPVRGLTDVIQGIRVIRGHAVLLTMTCLAGAASFFIGNSYQAQMPGLATDLGHGDGDATYSMLLAADAAGALAAGIVLESRGLLRPRVSTALVFGMMWCATLASFAVKAAVERSGVDPEMFEDIIMGTGYPEGTTGRNVGRQVAIRSGLPLSVAGQTVSRFCASGLQAIASAAAQIVATGF